MWIFAINRSFMSLFALFFKALDVWAMGVTLYCFVFGKASPEHFPSLTHLSACGPQVATVAWLGVCFTLPPWLVNTVAWQREPSLPPF